MVNHTLRLARQLRETMSLPEVMIWSRIRGDRPGFPRIRRQKPIGPYVADFYCAKARLVIEIDGESHSTGDHPKHDLERDAWMRAQGYEIVRILAVDVLREPDEVVEGLLNLIRERV